MKRHMLLIGLFFLLALTSLSAAQGTADQGLLGSDVYVVRTVNDSSGTSITVSLLVFEQGQPPQSLDYYKSRMETIYGDCSKQFQASDLGYQSCVLNASQKLSAEATYPVNFTSLEGANFSFSYWNAFKLGGPGPTAIENCEKVSATNAFTVKDFNGNDRKMYTATCKVKKSLYEGRKLRVTAAYLTEAPDILYSEETIYLSDTSINISFVTYLTDALRGVTGTDVSTPAGSLPCLGAFLILGLLMASMYFSGKSPATLLDITAPRLPSPKGFVAGGQILAPYGYTELKRTTRKSMGEAAKIATLVGGTAEKNIASNKKKVLDEAAKKMTADEAAIKKAVVMEYLAKGGSFDKAKQVMKAHHLMSEEDHATFRKMLEKLERAGGKDALFSKTAQDWVLKRDLMDTLDTLTYKGGKVTGRVQRAVGKLYGVDRYAILGPIVTGSLDSMLRSTSKLKNLAKAGAIHGAQFVRETGRLAVETAGGKAAMESLKQKSPGIFNELTREAREIKIGKITPMHLRMAQMYEDLYQEMHKDQISFLLKKIYEKAGVNAAKFTDEVLFEAMHKNVDVLKLIGYDSAKLASLEREIAGILSNNALSLVEKKHQLETLYGTLGGSLGTSYIQMKEHLNSLGHDEAEGHVKLLTLIETLDRHNKEMAAAKEGEVRAGNEYYSLVGRGNLHGSDFTQELVFRRMYSDFETGHATRETRLQDVLYAALLETENRVRTLRSEEGLQFLPEFMRDKSTAISKTEANRKMLASLITDEGERVLKELTNGKNRNTATIDDFMKVLYGNDYLLKSQGIKKDEKYGIHIDEKTGRTVHWEDDKIVKADKRWWRANMDGQWFNGFDTRDLGQVGAAVERVWSRGHYRPNDPGIEATMDRFPGAKTWSPAKREYETMKLYVKEWMSKELHNTFNDRYAMNGFGGTMHETFRAQICGMAGVLANELRHRGFEENHKDIKFLENFDVHRSEDVNRLKYMFGTRYKKEVSEAMERGVTHSDIIKGTWIRTWEGNYMPYNPNMPVSDNDLVISGRVTLRDNKGVLRAFNPDSVQIAFKGREDLAQAFHQVAGSDKPHEWEPLMKKAVQWKNENGYDYKREQIFGALVTMYRHKTTDYLGYGKDTAMRITPKQDSLSLAPSLLSSFGVEAPGLMKTLKPIQDFAKLAGNWAVRMAHDGAGDRYVASYDLSPKSQFVKMHQMRLGMQILQTDFNELLKTASTEYERRQLSAAYRSYALSFGGWHNVWEVTVDRNPQRTSTAHNAQQSWAGAFQYGPAQPMPLRANLRGYMDRAEYTNFMAMQGWPAMIARKLIMPYQKMIAGTQRAMQGYVGRSDATPHDALHPYGNYTQPRLLETLRFANPMSFSWGRGWAGKAIQKMNMFPESSAERAQLTGYDHQLGLTQRYSLSGVSTVYKGADGIARNMLANPGQSWMDTRAYEQMAGTMAEYLMMKSGKMSGYYANDPLIRRSALTDTIRRTVSAETLALKRQQELMGYGITQNTLYSWANPLLFAWHMGIPGYPQSLSPKELISGAVNRWRRGYSEGNMLDSVKGQLKRAGLAMNRAFTPYKGSLHRWCRCGVPGIGPGVCKMCGNRI